MSRFKKMNDNIYSIMNNLLNSQNLCKLLHYKDSDPLSNLDIPDPGVLLLKNIFPVPKIASVDEEANSYVSVILDQFRTNRSSRGIKDSKIVFNVICHEDLWKLEESLRPFSIMNEIDKIFNENHISGVGKLQFSSAQILLINESYSGYQMSYNTADTN